MAADGRTKEMHVAMVMTPDDWPMWPMLPLKRYVALGHPAYPRQTGCLVAGDQDTPIVYLTSAYQFNPRLVEQYGNISYGSPEAMVDDGWLVD